jgi:hypothetical protein
MPCHCALPNLEKQLLYPFNPVMFLPHSLDCAVLLRFYTVKQAPAGSMLGLQKHKEAACQVLLQQQQQQVEVERSAVLSHSLQA